VFEAFRTARHYPVAWHLPRRQIAGWLTGLPHAANSGVVDAALA
jgi:hypothetical protein